MTPNPIQDAIRTLKAQGQSLRQIAQLLKLSRNTVRRVLRVQAAEEPEPAMPAAINLAELRQAFTRAQGNVVRAQQLLAAEYNLTISYSTLTRWVRDAGLREPPKRAGEYVFGPGEEMQHDTSPHRVLIGGKQATWQCASLVLGYSRRLFVQYYPNYTRFEARQFLLDAVRFMGGACGVCMIDNTSVIVARGSGADAEMAPEMAAFARTLGFEFRAHRIRHADRKGKIERPFAWIETNFLPGRSFNDFDDLNAQALGWCRQVANAKPKLALDRRSPDELFPVEQTYLQPLPSVFPPVYQVLERVVDIYGYVAVDTHRYSAPERLVGQDVTAYKYPREIQIHHRGRLVATHPRILSGQDRRSKLPDHHPIPKRRDPTLGLEAQLLPDSAELIAYARALKQRGHGRGTRALRRLLDLQRTYPRDPFLAAVQQAAQFGLYDLGRLEKLVLQNVAGLFFNLHPDGDDHA